MARAPSIPVRSRPASSVAYSRRRLPDKASEKPQRGNRCLTPVPSAWLGETPREGIMRNLRKNGALVSDIGLGCMGMSDLYGPADDTESTATIHAALDAGVTLLDTGDYYGMGHNELLLRDALRRGVRRESVFIQVKFGGQRDPSGAFVGHDASPAMAKSSLAYTLTRLGTDYVDLYQPARLDPQVPIEDT